jgi:hypothetical protein
MRKSSVFGAAAIAALAIALTATGAQAAQLISNGDFASGFTNWTQFTTANGTIGVPQVTAFDVKGTGANNAAQFQVGDLNSAGLQEGGGIRQTVNATAGLLTFSTDFAASISGGINESGGIFSVLLDGVVLNSFDTGQIASTERGTLSFATNVTAGSHVITLEVTRPFLTTAFSVPLQYFDNVSAIQGGPVPEPATWGLMVLGFGVAGGSLRRRARLAARAA